jgi:hypothetical protein
MMYFGRGTHGSGSIRSGSTIFSKTSIRPRA